MDVNTPTGTIAKPRPSQTGICHLELINSIGNLVKYVMIAIRTIYNKILSFTAHRPHHYGRHCPGDHGNRRSSEPKADTGNNRGTPSHFEMIR